MIGWIPACGADLGVLATTPFWGAVAVCFFVAVGTVAMLISRLESRLLQRLQVQTQGVSNGMKRTHGWNVASSVGDLAPFTSIIIQVSQTNAPSCPVFVASAEATLGSSPAPTLVQGQDAAEVINQALAKVYPAEMNGQIGSVRLLPGTYPLSSPLLVTRGDMTLSGSTGVKLVRAAAPAKSLHADRQIGLDLGPLISVAASDVVIRDLQLDGAVPGTGPPKMGNGASAGIVIAGALRNVVVENVSVCNVSATAISAVINSSNAPAGGLQSGIVVRGCTIDRCGMGGISLAKRSSDSTPAESSPEPDDHHQTPNVVDSTGHLVWGNRISRTGSHAVCLTGVSCSQVIANQMQHVSLYNEPGVFGHGIAVDGNCGNDPVREVIISANIIDTVHSPANKQVATCTGIEIADGITGAICTSNHVSKVAMGYGVYFGGGIAPSSHGVIASNVVAAAGSYGVWVNARGSNSSSKFPHGSAGPSTGCSVVGNCLQDNAPAGLRSDNVCDETIVGNVISNSDGAAGLMLLGGNRRVAIVANTVGGQQLPTRAQWGILVQQNAPSTDTEHSYVPSSGSGLIDVGIRSNVCPDSNAHTGHGLHFAGTAVPHHDDTRVYSSATGDVVEVSGNLH